MKEEERTLSLVDAGRIPLAAAFVQRAECLAWSPSGQAIAVAGRGDEVLVWDASAGRPLTVYRGHSGCEEVLALAWSPDETRLASSASDTSVQAWEPQSGELLWQVDFDEGRSRRQRQRAGRDRSWMLEELAFPVEPISKGESRPRALAWSPDGAILAVGAGGSGPVYLLAASTGKQVRVCAGASGGVKTLAWTPDGKYILAAVPGRSVRRYDAATGERLGQGDVSVNWEGALALSPDGERIVIGLNAGRVQVGKRNDSAERGVEPLYTLNQEVTRFPIMGMAFSPGGRLVASFGSDGVLWLWDVLTGEVYARSDRALKVLAAAWSPTSDLLAAATSEGFIQTWSVAGELPPHADAAAEELAVQAGNTVERNHRPFLDGESLLLNGLMGRRFVVQVVQEHSVMLVGIDSSGGGTGVSRASLLTTHFALVQTGKTEEAVP